MQSLHGIPGLIEFVVVAEPELLALVALGGVCGPRTEEPRDDTGVLGSVMRCKSLI